MKMQSKRDREANRDRGTQTKAETENLREMEVRMQKRDRHYSWVLCCEGQKTNERNIV